MYCIHSSTLRSTNCSERCQRCTLPLSGVLEGPCIIEDDVARKACWGASLSPMHRCLTDYASAGYINLRALVITIFSIGIHVWDTSIGLL